jgi:hypothetical protein
MKFEKVLTVVVCVFALVILLSGVALAQSGPGDSPIPTPTPETTPEPFPWGDEVPTPQEFLGWLALGGAPLIGAITSLLQRKSTWFQNLSSEQRWWVSFGLGAGLPALAGLLLLYMPTDVWTAIQPLWMVLGTALMGYLGKELTYLLLVKPAQRDWLNGEVGEPLEIEE